MAKQHGSTLPGSAQTVATGGRLWEVPYDRNQFFTGREAYLQTIRRRFTADDPQGRHQALSGLGGIGKSQLAIEYAYRHREHYSLVWWLPAEDATAMGLSFARLARAVGLKLGPEVSLDEVRHRVRRVLGQLSDWLLIFDNAVRPADIKNYLPLTRAGHVLITSQTTDWGDLAVTVPVRPLERHESIEFLHKRASVKDTGDLANKVAQTLGDLPLALEQAAVVMQETKTDYSGYLRAFEMHWAELLQKGLATGDHPDSMGMSLELSFRQVEEGATSSAALMYLCSFLAPESIPKSFLTASSELLPPPLGPAVTLGIDGVVEPLLRYSLIDSTPTLLSVHRLVAALVRRRLTEEEQTKWAMAAARAVAAAYRYNSDEPSTWPSYAAGMAHALAVAEHVEKLKAVPDVAADLFSNAGRYLMKQGRLAEARDALERAIDLTRRVYGNSHPRTSDAANNLGRVLQRQGERKAAGEYFALSLAIDGRVYGQDNVRVATVANNYGMCLLGMREYAAARHHFEWAMSVFESNYGPDHAKLAPVLNNLGCALRDSGEGEAAREAFARALGIAEENYPGNHPTIASIRYNTGMLMRSLGDLVAAEQHLRFALTADETSFGSSHPDVKRDIASLAKVLMEQGRRDEAQALAKRGSAALQEAQQRTRTKHPLDDEERVDDEDEGLIAVSE